MFLNETARKREKTREYPVIACDKTYDKTCDNL
jgi:hypothetical protein